MLEGDRTTDIRGLHFFMTTMGIEELADKTIAKLYDATKEWKHWRLDSIQGYLQSMDESRDSGHFEERLLKCGLGKAKSAKVVSEFLRVFERPVNLKLLMIASGSFLKGGMGKEKLAQLEAQGLSMAALCNMSGVQIKENIPVYKGFNIKTAQVLADGVAEFRVFYKTVRSFIDVDGRLPKKEKAVEGPLSGVKVAFTSYRDKDQEDTIKANGGLIVKYGPSMDVLLWKKGAKFMDKIERAGKKAMHWDDFMNKYKVK
jgi:hypothetical protein